MNLEKRWLVACWCTLLVLLTGCVAVKSNTVEEHDKFIQHSFGTGASISKPQSYVENKGDVVPSLTKGNKWYVSYRDYKKNDFKCEVTNLKAFDDVIIVHIRERSMLLLNNPYVLSEFFGNRSVTLDIQLKKTDDYDEQRLVDPSKGISFENFTLNKAQKYGIIYVLKMEMYQKMDERNSEEAVESMTKEIDKFQKFLKLETDDDSLDIEKKYQVINESNGKKAYSLFDR